MDDLMRRLAELPKPEVPAELARRVRARMHVQAPAPLRRGFSRAEALIGVLVAAVSVLQTVWTVVFLNSVR